jgi:hypothetical protein
MPVRQYSPNRPVDFDQLVARLAAEWQAPAAGTPEPVILEESNARGDVVHVYVVWSDWAHLNRERRGEVIMDAAEKVKQLDEVLKITLAMGLTPTEADQFGLKWR